QEIAFEQYVKTINVEANLAVEIGKTVIYPAANRYLGQLAETAIRLKELGVSCENPVLSKVAALTSDLVSTLDKLDALRSGEHSDEIEVEAVKCRDEIIPAIGEVRAVADALEGLVADDLWPLPTYQEMLFIK